MTYNKYKNKKVVIDGIKFDSQKEGRRYCELKLLERAGEIRDLELQVRFDFEHTGVNLGFYKADFCYSETLPIKHITEDCKGFKTPMYKLKKKMMKAFHGIEILET